MCDGIGLWIVSIQCGGDMPTVPTHLVSIHPYTKIRGCCVESASEPNIFSDVRAHIATSFIPAAFLNRWYLNINVGRAVWCTIASSLVVAQYVIEWECFQVILPQ